METVQRTLATTFGSRAFLGSQGLALLVAGAGALVLLVGALTDDRGRQRRGGTATATGTGPASTTD